VLVAVVGPSGAGKDTLMAGARAALGEDPAIRFARRVITRPAEAGGEDHLPMARDEFLRARDAGDFALWWAAHGLLYGIPRGIEEDLAAGRAVVANLSRTVLGEAARRFPLLILNVTAPASLRHDRLLGRGREATVEIPTRLSREVPLPASLNAQTIWNDGAPETGIARLVAALSRAAEAARRSGRARPAPPG
jgi:phosphonate metabolism protein PhnN/1,5-bisphosphokinase (PRPP-forming)